MLRAKYPPRSSWALGKNMKDEFVQLTVDTGEVLLDSAMTEGLARDFPIIGSLFSLLKISRSIPDKLLAIKVRRMITALEKIAATDRKQLVGKLTSEDDARQKVGEISLLTLDRCDDLRKADYLAYSLCAYIEQKITLVEFRHFAHAISNCFVVHLEDLVSDVSAGIKSGRYLPPALRTLVSGGFVFLSGAARPQDGMIPALTEAGEKFVRIVNEYSKRA
jgi:hypothetical protein